MDNNDFQMDFIGVGAPKTGTTWIAECLKEHQQICFSSKKEINFFNKENFFFIKNKVLGGNWRYENGLEWYKQFFSHCRPGQVKGEFSTIYLYDAVTPALIKKHFPDSKIIIVLRNPADLFYSHYNHANSQFSLPPLEKAVEDENGFIKYGFYSLYIKRYLEYFDRDKILILIYDDLKKNPENFIRKLYKFLGVDESFKPESLNKIVNPTAPQTAAEVRAFFALRNSAIKIFGKLIVKFPKFAKKLLFFDALAARKVLGMAKGKKDYKKMSEQIREKLDMIYKDEIEELERLLAIDLSCWKKND